GLETPMACGRSGAWVTPAYAPLARSCWPSSLASIEGDPGLRMPARTLMLGRVAALEVDRGRINARLRAGASRRVKMVLSVTDSAAAQLGSIVEEHGIEESQGLRLFARSGGCACSGPAFGMTIDMPAAEDQVMVVAGIRFIIDPLSASNLEGASIDY